MRHYSIVVPLIGQRTGFETTLASVLRSSPPGTQVIVPHGGDYDDPWHVADEVELLPLKAHDRENLSGLVLAALSRAGKELVGVVLPGMELGDDWPAEVDRQFDDPAVASVATCLRAASSGQSVTGQLGFGTAGRIRFNLPGHGKPSRDLLGSGPGFGAGFYRNEALGWLPAAGLGIDPGSLALELLLGLHVLGYQSRLAPVSVTRTGEPAESRPETRLPSSVVERLLARHGAGKGSLTRALGDLLGGHPQRAFARLVALRQRAADRDFASRLQQARDDRARFESTRLKKSPTSSEVPARMRRAA